MLKKKKPNEVETVHKLAVFNGKQIRRAIHDDEWWFSVSDIVGALTDSANVSDYIKKLRKRDEELSKGWGQIVTPLSIETVGGKQKVNCANTEGIFRIIQSIPCLAKPQQQRLPVIRTHKDYGKIKNPLDKAEVLREKPAKIWRERAVRKSPVRKTI